MKRGLAFNELETLINALKLYKTTSELREIVQTEKGRYDVMYTATASLLDNSEEINLDKT